MKQTVLITGASTGLGLALAKRFVELGDTVYGTSKTTNHWKKAKHELPSSNFKLFLVEGASEVKVKSFISKVIKKEKKIDIVINNAGYASKPVRTEKESLIEFQKNIANNLTATFLFSKHIIPVFRKKKNGLLINISSMAGVRAVPTLSAYSASKFGVLALTQAIAKENQDTPIKCISISPGGINTKMRQKVFKDAAKQQTAEFVADKIIKIVEGELPIPTGNNVVIRHRKITAIQPLPGV